MVQPFVLVGQAPSISGSATYVALFNGVVSTTLRRAEHPISTEGLLRNFRVSYQGQWPATASTFTYTLLKNGVPTPVVLQFGAAYAQVQFDVTHQVQVAPGDRLVWAVAVTGGGTLVPSRLTYAFDFVGARAQECAHAGAGSAALNTGSSVFYNPFWFDTADTTSANTLVPVAQAGRVDRLDYSLDVSPGTGKNFVLTLMKNGTAQDGSGSTVDTRVTISDSAVAGSWSATQGTAGVVYAAGDTIQVRVAPTGTPTGSFLTASMRFKSDTDGNANLSIYADGAPSTSAINYAGPFVSLPAWGTPEFTHMTPVGFTNFTLSNPQALLTTAPGGSTFWQFAPRREPNDGRPGDLAENLTVVISAAATTGSTGTATTPIVITYNQGDMIAFQSAPSASAPASTVCVGLTYIIAAQVNPTAIH